MDPDTQHRIADMQRLAQEDGISIQEVIHMAMTTRPWAFPEGSALLEWARSQCVDYPGNRPQRGGCNDRSRYPPRCGGPHGPPRGYAGGIPPGVRLTPREERDLIEMTGFMHGYGRDMREGMCNGVGNTQVAEMGYAPEMGYGPQMGFGPEMGHGPGMGRGPGMGYGPEMGYGPDMGDFPEDEMDDILMGETGGEMPARGGRRRPPRGPRGGRQQGGRVPPRSPRSHW